MAFGCRDENSWHESEIVELTVAGMQDFQNRCSKTESAGETSWGFERIGYELLVPLMLLLLSAFRTDDGTAEIVHA